MRNTLGLLNYYAQNEPNLCLTPPKPIPRPSLRTPLLIIGYIYRGYLLVILRFLPISPINRPCK